MHLTEFHVLLVDDEPDVHEVSRLAMRDFKVYGLPIRLHSAKSKAEGIELIESLTLGRPDICKAAVALIDVVMETDNAGLELCDHVRNAMGNRGLQIYVRTGQPGIAPERAVVDRYDIQGYLAKPEVTADKLYTVVRAGVRGYYFTGLSHSLQDLVHFLVPAASSRARITENMRQWQRLARSSRSGGDTAGISAALGYLVDDQFLVGLEAWSDEGALRQRRDELAARPATTLNDEGDRFTLDGRDLLIQIAPTATNAAVHYLLRGTVPAPEWEVFLYHRYLRTLSALWKQAGA